MELKRQWCDQPMCPDFTRVDAGNIRVHSYIEHRFSCTTCRHTFSADKGTFFETLRSERHRVLEVLEALGERNSLRALERLKHCRPNTILHWLDLAGQHLAVVSAELIQELHPTQAQVDELWTFVKKNKNTVNRMIHRKWVIPGFGERLLCRVGSGSSVISAMNEVKSTLSHF